MNKKLENTLVVKWSKKENDFIWHYPNRQGEFLGYDIIKNIREQVKNFATDYDITTFKAEIKLTKSADERMQKLREEGMVWYEQN